MKLLLAAILTVNLALAQSNAGARAMGAEYSVPFGTATGQLLMLGDYLVFVDSQAPESSFVLPRATLSSANAQGSTVTLQSTQPVRNAAGDVSQLSFRVTGDPMTVVSWYQSNTPRGADRTVANSEAAGASAQSFEATHDHFVGSCHGRLVISGNQLAYESVDDANHSRRWEYSSIREIKHPNPYEIRIKPSVGEEYKLKLGGAGMDPSAFTKLVDQVTQARAGRR
jgi:hypothetical protein